MNDKIIEIKIEIRRIMGDSNLNCIEKYDLIKGKVELLNEKEYKILLKEYKRDYKTYDRIKDIKDVLSMFLTGTGLLITIGTSIIKEQLEVVITNGIFFSVIAVYVVLAIVALALIQSWRTFNMNRIQHVLDILE